MAVIKFKDKARTTLASSIGPTDTNLTVAAATGDKFPAIDGANNPTAAYFIATLFDAAGNIELVKCSHRLTSTDSFGSATYPLVRDWDGRNGGGRSWASGDGFAIRLPSKVLEDVLNMQANLDTHAADASGKHFVTGTRVCFQQLNVPTGWTRETGAGYNDATMRCMTASCANGGSTTWSTSPLWSNVLSSSSVAITTAQMPSHAHTSYTGVASANHTHTFSGTTSIESQNHVHGVAGQVVDAGGAGPIGWGSTWTLGGNLWTGGQNANHTHSYNGTTSWMSADHQHIITAEGGGQGHAHTWGNMNLKYVDFVIGIKGA